ncbi:MAG: hypothetical protein Q8Q63_00155 [Phaeovulum sp.]|jgi:hypothetical protein|uniref:hypothetical protein n=1 Tax=Phaeovulum sp. TaxID=2934796 RepID=UPI0027322B71|nr:hypothetical protein [Phaeovulum sp.]MDP2062384.1 hypothetical protein [Phaeovulum sp.]MDP3859979.1 hypothetical protein [Phaeovulum sp.]
MSDAFKCVEQGLEEVFARAQGDRPAAIHEIELAAPDVQAIRAQTGLSRAKFTRSNGAK